MFLKFFNNYVVGIQCKPLYEHFQQVIQCFHKSISNTIIFGEKQLVNYDDALLKL